MSAGMGWIVAVCEGCGRHLGSSYHYVGAPNPERVHREWSPSTDCGCGQGLRARNEADAAIARSKTENPMGLGYTLSELERRRGLDGAA